MSSCRHGGRDAYERPAAREYDQSKPVRGRIVYEDGGDSCFTFARFVNGAERRVSHVEIDGDAYLKRYPTKDAANDGGQTFWCWNFGRHYIPTQIVGDDYGKEGCEWNFCPCCGADIRKADADDGPSPMPEPMVKTCPRCGRDEWYTPGLFEPKTCRCGARYEEG